MLDMPIRAGKRIQDVQINIREKMARRTGERQQTASLHRQRMSCSDSVKSFTNTQDWTGGMGISPSGRFQVIEEAAPAGFRRGNPLGRRMDCHRPGHCDLRGGAAGGRCGHGSGIQVHQQAGIQN